MLTELVTGVVTLVTEWVIRVAVVISLSAHVVLALLAGIRRRQAYGWWMSILWLAYQGADWAAPYVLSNLSLGSTPHEQQLLVFWLPTIVAHLGGPDNITAYSMEDNKLSLRQYSSAFFQILGIIFLMYKQVKIAASTGALFWASVVKIGVGSYKYLERVWAFWEADFGKMRNSSKNKKERVRIQRPSGSRKELCNEQALLVAHELLGITMGAFADFPLKEDKLKKDTNLKEIFSVQGKDAPGWENMCKVVEMELSLMYDILYTKAAVIHSWAGYVVRIVSPVVTATVIVLFWFHNEDGQRRADVIITNILLFVTFLLDVRWLFGAAASTWTYAFFNASPGRWLQHQVCCTRQWRRLRSLVLFLDPWQPPCRWHVSGYRLWSGTMGQYNLLQEVTHGTTSSCFSCSIKKFGLEDAWMEYKYSRRLQLDSAKNVKELLFKQIQKAFKMERPTVAEASKPEPPKPPRPEEEWPSPEPPVEASKKKRHRHLDEELGFLPEFQELILIWHVTTDAFFILASHEQLNQDHHRKHVKAIKAVSDYMAFLAAVRPDMLPGLKLRSQHQATREALDILWRKYREKNPSSTAGDKKQFVEFLKTEEDRDSEKPNENRGKSALYDFSIVLSDGIKFATLLLALLSSEDSKRTLEEILHEGSKSRQRFIFLVPDMEEARPRLIPTTLEGMLDLILNSWVRMLIYVSIRCGRDSHAKQLGRGCELTTIVWILSEHATIFAPKRRDGRMR